MSKPLVFEKPVGFRDTLPEALVRKRGILDVIQAELGLWGYEPIETPTLEYYDTVGQLSSTQEGRLFKLLEPSGRSLVLRSDMTAPIARVVSSLLKEETFPIRLAYQGNVFRAQENEAGRRSEFTEVGVELIGEEAPDADAEVLALAITSLQRAQVEDFIFAVGHVELLNCLFAELLDEVEQAGQLRYFLQQKNYVGYQAFVEAQNLSKEQKEKLLALLELSGGQEVMEKVRALAKSEATQRAVAELADLWQVLELYGVTEHMLLDLRLISQRDYYTGVIFEGYADQLGFPVCSGGRYDHLLKEFGRPAPAIGFSLKIDRLLEVSKLAEERLKRIWIAYTEEERNSAFQLAKEHRSRGEQVTMHCLKQGKRPVVQGYAEEYWLGLEKGGASDE